MGISRAPTVARSRNPNSERSSGLFLGSVFYLCASFQYERQENSVGPVQMVRFCTISSTKKEVPAGTAVICLSESRSLSKQDEKRRGEDTRAMTSKARTRMCACVCACSRSLRACVRALADFERVLERGLSIYNIMFIFLSSCASVCSREAQASHARRRALSSSPFRHDLPPSLTTSLPRDLPLSRHSSLTTSLLPSSRPHDLPHDLPPSLTTSIPVTTSRPPSRGRTRAHTHVHKRTHTRASSSSSSSSSSDGGGSSSSSRQQTAATAAAAVGSTHLCGSPRRHSRRCLQTARSARRRVKLGSGRGDGAAHCTPASARAAHTTHPAHSAKQAHHAA